MRDYGKVHSTFWTSPTTGPLSDDARMLALYLLTCPHANSLGCFRLPDGYVMEDLRWSRERVSEGFAELFAKGFGNRCGTTFWVLIPAHLKFNSPENPNQVKALARLAQQVPVNASVAKTLADVLDQQVETTDAAAGHAIFEAIKRLRGNPSGTVTQTVSKPIAVAVTEAIAEGKASAQSSADADSAPVRVELPPPVISIPLNTGPDYAVYPPMVSEWSSAYPAVDVMQQLREMRVWSLDNPKKRKTKQGIRKFIGGWLAREQDRGATTTRTQPMPREAPTRSAYDVAVK